jgi:hypothetical protein
MRLELAEDNGPQAYGRVLIGQCLDKQLAKIRDGAGNVPADQLRQWVSLYAPPFALGIAKHGSWSSHPTPAVIWDRTGSSRGPPPIGFCQA